MRLRKLWIVLGTVAFSALVFAVLFPVFAVARSGSGKSFTPKNVAAAINEFHRKTGRWPTTFEEMNSSLRYHPRDRDIRIGFIPLAIKGDSADYVITVNGTLERFHATNGYLQADSSPTAQGFFPAIRK